MKARTPPPPPHPMRTRARAKAEQNESLMNALPEELKHKILVKSAVLPSQPMSIISVRQRPGYYTPMLHRLCGDKLSVMRDDGTVALSLNVDRLPCNGILDTDADSAEAMDAALDDALRVQDQRGYPLVLDRQKEHLCLFSMVYCSAVDRHAEPIGDVIAQEHDYGSSLRAASRFFRDAPLNKVRTTCVVPERQHVDLCTDESPVPR